MIQDTSLLALQHTKQMEKDYFAEIAYSIHESEIFRDDSTFRARIPQTQKVNFFTNQNKLIDIDSVESIFLPEIQDALAENRRIAILNFADFKNPGGLFLEGSTAQEESLCHCSFLYNVLEAFDKSYYAINRKNTNSALYNNSAIYSAGVRFWNIKLGEEITEQTPSALVDVITCAAPNKKSAQQYYNISSMQVVEILRDRIEFLKAICQIKKVDILIAGAWGTGVFGNNTRLVAQLFKNIFDTSTQYPHLIIHPVPQQLSSTNYMAFRSIFSKIIKGTENNKYQEWY